MRPNHPLERQLSSKSIGGSGSLCKSLHSDPYAQIPTMRMLDE